MGWTWSSPTGGSDDSLGEHGSGMPGGAEGPGERKRARLNPGPEEQRVAWTGCGYCESPCGNPNTHMDTALLTMGLLPEVGEELCGRKLHFTHSASSWAQAAVLRGPVAKQKPEEQPPLPFPGHQGARSPQGAARLRAQGPRGRTLPSRAMT